MPLFCIGYETTYEWSEEKQRKVQRKRCIGQFVPGTDEIIPNGPRGKKTLIENPTIRQEINVKAHPAEPENAVQTLADIRPKLEAFERALQNLTMATNEVLHAIAAVSDETKLFQHQRQIKIPNSTGDICGIMLSYLVHLKVYYRGTSEEASSPSI